MKKVLVGLCLVIPFSTVSASIANELNSFLDSFFGNPYEAQEIQTVPPVLETEEEYEILENPTQEDLANLQKKIIASESNLQEFENTLQTKEQELWSKQNQKKTASENISLLDQQISIQNQKLEKLRTQKNIWEKELETITREKEDIKAQIRAYEKEYEQDVVQDVIRSQSLSEDKNIQLLKWFFSPKTISQILEEKTAKQQKKEKNQNKIRRLKNAQFFLENKENHAAKVFQQIRTLEQKQAQETATLREFLNAKARLEQNLNRTTEDLEREIQNAYRSRAQVLSELQSLRKAWENSKNTIREEEKQALFEFPLKKPIRVNVGFQDPAYEKEFGLPHDGVDFFAAQGTSVLAPADGIVQKTEIEDEGYAYLILNHGNDIYTIYGHVSEILVNEGEIVKQGDIIAKTGGTPGTKGAGFLTTGPHLHFSLFVNGEFIDPLLLLPEI